MITGKVLQGYMSGLMAEREIEAGPVNWEGCGAHTSQLWDWRRVLLVRAAEAKMPLQSLVVLTEKKRWKKKEQN